MMFLLLELVLMLMLLCVRCNVGARLEKNTTWAAT